MASLDDLGRALRHDAAANAPDASAIDVDAVTRAARARRRPRQWGAGALGLVAVLGFGGIAVGALTPPSLIAASESADTTAPESAGADELLAASEVARDAGLLSCGAVASAPALGPIGLALEVRLPSGATSGDEVTGTVRVINTGDEPRALITGTEAQAVILQGGIVVGETVAIGQVAQTVTIEPGVARDLPVRVSTRSCTDGAALPPGDYTVLSLIDTRRSFDEAPTVVTGVQQSLRLE